jgi:hypothetical protein
LPSGIHQKVIGATKTWYGVIEASRLGVGDAVKLEQLAKVIGPEALAAEVLKHYQGTNISVDISGMLDGVVAKLGQATLPSSAKA